MEKVIDQLLNKEFWKESMRKTCRNNKLNIDLITAYTPLRFRTAYYRFKAMYCLFYSAIREEQQRRRNDGSKIS